VERGSEEQSKPIHFAVEVFQPKTAPKTEMRTRKLFNGFSCW